MVVMVLVQVKQLAVAGVGSQISNLTSSSGEENYQTNYKGVHKRLRSSEENPPSSLELKDIDVQPIEQILFK